MSLALAPATAASTTGCGGDICNDLLVEEQACVGFTKATSPAGATCTDKRGLYSQCVLDSGQDLCKALVTPEAKASQRLEQVCGAAPS